MKMSSIPKNTCCDPDYFSGHVHLYLVGLTNMSVAKMPDGDQILLLEIHRHLRGCTDCHAGYVYLRTVWLTQQAAEGNSGGGKQLEANKRYLDELVASA